MHRSALIPGVNCLFVVVAMSTCVAAQEAKPSVLAVAPTTPAPSSEELSFRKAFIIANACEVAYMEGEPVIQMLRSMGVERHTFLDLAHHKKGGSDTQALAASIDGYTLICFRGTAGLSDWKTNLRTERKAISLGFFGATGYVHSGFWSAWEDVKPEVIKYLKEQRATNENEPASASNGQCHEILIGGHSLGGAIALIAGIELKREGYQVLGVFTFGQPKVFSEEVVKMSDQSPSDFPDIQRFIFADDPVPSLPPGYFHIGHEKYSREIGRILSHPQSTLFWPSIGDHRMSNYVKTLAQLILTLSKSDDTIAMANWLKERKSPLASYLRLPKKEAEKVMVGYSDSQERVRCHEKN